MDRNHFLRLFDILKGTKVKKYFDFYKRTLTWDIPAIEAYQWKKLKETLVFAFNHVSSYRQRFEELNLTPDSFNSLEDIKKLPPLGRKDIQDNFNDLLAAPGLQGKYFKSSSSGTTGTPVHYLHDIEGESAGLAAGYICWYMSGWSLNLKGLHIWGNPVSIRHWKKIPSRVKRFLFNQKYFPSILLNDLSNYPGIVKLISNYRPDYIDGYAHSIYSLAQYVKNRDISVPRCKVVFTTAENLLDHQNKVIESTLGPVSDTYGFGEINGVAAKPVGSDRYFIFEPHVLVEVEGRSDDGYKEIIVTDLDNRVMPFIRYKVGDLIDNVHAGNHEAKFKFKFFKKIWGRTADIIDLGNGKKILPVNLLGGTFIRQFKSIVRHKVVWNGKYLEFQFETTHEPDLQRLNKTIRDILKEYDVGYKICLVDKILPAKNGKYRYVEINV